MPQVYWVEAHNPEEQLDRCLAEYRQLYLDEKISPVPIYPIGAAYHEKGWQPTIDEMERFAQHASGKVLPAVSWWEWANANRYNLTPGMQYQPPAGQEPPDPPPQTIEERVDALELWAQTQGYQPPFG